MSISMEDLSSLFNKDVYLLSRGSVSAAKADLYTLREKGRFCPFIHLEKGDSVQILDFGRFRIFGMVLVADCLTVDEGLKSVIVRLNSYLEEREGLRNF